MFPHSLVNGSVFGRNRFATARSLIFVALLVPLFSSIIAAQPLSSVLLHSTGAISYTQTRIVYVMVNATGTYELDYKSQVLMHDTNSLSVLNHAISDASLLKGSLFVYNGMYQVNGTINMQSNVNVTLQDGVFINETRNTNIFSFSSVSNSSIFANSNAVIHGGAGTSEIGFKLVNCNNITISANQPNGLTVYNIGHSWIDGTNINNSLFQNLYGYQWMMSFAFPWHGILFDGMQNCQLINVTSDGLNGDSRSTLCIGGEGYPVNNVNITGGVYKNSYYDNGIYLGGWSQTVTNVNIINVTTSYNNAYKSGHSGIKIRPACNVTVINWTSNYDFNGIEMDTVADGESNTYNTGGSWYNNISGIINYPYNTGLILDLFGSNKNQSNMYNTFNLAINNATQTGVWIDNGCTGVISYNTIYLKATGCQKQAIDFSSSGGTVSHNTVFGRFVQNGKGGFTDIAFENLAGQNYNVINVYSTSGNPNGLYSGSLGTNVVNYPYT